MYTTLAVFASVLGLAVTGAAVYTAWYVFQLRKGKEGVDPPGQFERTLLLRWTLFDYSLLLLSLIGLLFLLTDLIGVLRDRDLYPYYHYGYLLCGFIFTLLGLLFMLARLFVVLRLANQGSAAPHNHDEPDEAHQAE
jgi:hypothetical protein